MQNKIEERKTLPRLACLTPYSGDPSVCPCTDSLSFVFGRMGGANDFHPSPQAGRGGGRDPIESLPAKEVPFGKIGEKI
ncbi:hypothetical protein CDAR_398161 [Caerostris darwini]|uniref:Uncharacterized protein n=1 Tax=Caerostris darwini TaxID=1538125 RepID=A0AAV4WTT6_9ARAC|nr:hypothetical protein CDAR_398161 [Caerostris darwini]